MKIISLAPESFDECVSSGMTCRGDLGTLRGKQGRVLRILRDDDKVIVQGLNLRFKHPSQSQKNPQGGASRRGATAAVESPARRSETNRRPASDIAGSDTKIRYAKKTGAV
jgi:large subunit ribosomal protein L24